MSGTGSETDPYLIEDVEDWNKFAESVLNGNELTENSYQGKFVKLAADIGSDESPVTKKIGDQSHSVTYTTPINTTTLLLPRPFSGVFDGGNHIITVAISDDAKGAALFGYVLGATIKNLTVKGTVSGGEHAAGLVGISSGTGNKIEDCVVATTVEGDSIGGILGHGANSDIEIENCVFKGVLQGKNGSGFGLGSILNVPLKGVFMGWADNGGTKIFKNCLYIYQNAQSLYFRNLDLVQMPDDAGTVTLTECYKTLNVGSFGELAYLDASAAPVDEESFVAEKIAVDGTIFYVVLKKHLMSGSGTEVAPYIINDEKEWNSFADLVGQGYTFAGKFIKLNADISVTKKVGVVKRDGTLATPFAGTFDGGGKTITASIEDVKKSGTALFSYISGATIKNLTLAGSITGGIHAAGIVGFSSGTGNKIENCVVSATINGGSHIGGILGHGLTSDISIDNCVFRGLLVGGSEAKGVFFGWGDNGGTKTVSNCLYIQQDGQKTDNLDLVKMDAGSVVMGDCYKTAAVGLYGMLVYLEKPTDAITEENVAADETKFYVVLRNVSLPGRGTESDPYLISNDDHWDEFAEFVNNGATFARKFIKLTADIGSKLPVTAKIGDYTQGKVFSGTFDGKDGSKIHAVTVNIIDKNHLGTAVFGFIDGATIKNLIVKGSIDGGVHAAGLVGISNGTGNKIEKCVVSATIDGGSHIGGILGHGLTSDISIDNCVFRGKLEHGETAKGVFFGWGDDGGAKSVSNCLYIQQDGQKTDNLDLARMSAGSVTVTDCYKTENVGSYGKLVYLVAPANEILIEKIAADRTKFYIKAASISGVSPSYFYTGNEIDLSYKVTDMEGKELVAEKDYTVLFTPSTINDVGEYTLTITAKEEGLYTASKIVNFSVVKFNLENAIISGVNPYYFYTGNEIDLLYKVIDYAENELAAGTDYTISLNNAPVKDKLSVKDMGDYTLTLTATEDGIYTGSKIVNFSVVKFNLENATVSGVNPYYLYTGNEIDLLYKVIDYAGNELVAGTDYTISLNNAPVKDKLSVKDIGDYTLTFTATENGIYTGSKEISFPVSDYIPVTASTFTMDGSYGVPYKVDKDVSVGERINIVGDVLLILNEGKTLNATKGIELSNDNKLTIDGKGTLNAQGENGNSGIGARRFGTLVIEDGITNAKGGTSAAGIGGLLRNKAGGTITINGGTVSATGGIGGAGIGGGSGDYGTSEIITINGGTVSATGGDFGAGIGGGDKGASEIITINGGTVSATGGSGGAGIGGGFNGTSGTVNINDGRVSATGGSEGAGIGGGYNGTSETVNINGGRVSATGGDFGAGIGGGFYGTSGTTTINGGTVLAMGGIGGVGIGSGYRASASGSLILGWTNEDDFIYADNYDGVETIKFVDGKSFYYEEGSKCVIVENTDNIGSKTLRPFDGNKNSLKYVSISGVKPSYYYTGNKIDLSYKVMDLEEKILVEGSDYIASLNNSLVKDVGDYTLTITATKDGAYTDSKTVSFSVVKLNLENSVVSGVSPYYFYTGDEIDLSYKVTDSEGKLLIEGTDYTASLNNAPVKDVGDYTITIAATKDGVYTGSKTVSFSVVKLNLENSVVSGLKPYYLYTGDEMVLSYNATDSEGKLLVEGIDYTASLNNAPVKDVFRVKDKGAYTLTITAKENGIYTGKKTVSFAVLDAVQVTSETKEMTSPFYKVSNDVSINERIVVTGDVMLILDEGKTLTASKGIELSNGNKLTIDGKGTLKATGNTRFSGIGSYDFGMLIIDGGIVDAEGGYLAAGIGGSYKGFHANSAVGHVIINGGKILVKGGDFAAGIGGSAGNNFGTVIINGGEVKSNAGGSNADDAPAAIGGGNGGTFDTVAIYGGQVTANASSSELSVGIGPGAKTTACGTVILGYTNQDDFIYASNYNGVKTIKFDEGKQFYYVENEKNIIAEDINSIGGKALLPYYDKYTLQNAVISGVQPYYRYTGNKINLTYKVTNFEGEELSKESDFTESFSPSPVQGVGEYTLTLTAKEGSAYTGAQTIRFSVVDGYIPVTSLMSTMDGAYGFSYRVVNDVIIAERIKIIGNVKLILDEGKTLTASKGIELSDGNELTIDGKGTLSAVGDDYDSGIGAKEVGSLIVDGGAIGAQGGKYGAGIGGSLNNSVGGSITINGGIVAAVGGNYAAGIGGGRNTKDNSLGVCGTITINGGKVWAYSANKIAAYEVNTGEFLGYVTSNAAGIGPGHNAPVSGSVTLGWRTKNDVIYATSYNNVENIGFARDGHLKKQQFVYLDGNKAYIATIDNIAGKTLYPFDDKDLMWVNIKGVEQSYTYTGKAINPSFEVYNFRGQELSKENYAVSIMKDGVETQAVNTGEYTMVFTGKGNYEGTKEVKFSIVPEVVHNYAAVQVLKDEKGTRAEIDGEYSGTDAVNITEDIENVAVTFNRNFTVDLEKGGFSTLMLPFSVSTEDVGGLGGVYKFAYVADCDGDKKNDVCINKVWEDSDTKHQTLEEYTPYMVRMKESTLKINKNVTLKATAGGTLYDERKQTDKEREGSWQMRGVFGYKEWKCNDGELGKVWGYTGEPRNGAKIGKYMKFGKDVRINPFRAYLFDPNGEQLKCTDNSAPQSIAASPYAKAYTAEFLPAPARSDASATASSEVASVDGFGGMQVVVVDDESGKGTTVIGRMNPATGEIRMQPRVKQTYDLKGRRVNGEKKNARGAYYGKKSRK
jgi:hypothetical protein